MLPQLDNTTFVRKDFIPIQKDNQINLIAANLYPNKRSFAYFLYNMYPNWSSPKKIAT